MKVLVVFQDVTNTCCNLLDVHPLLRIRQIEERKHVHEQAVITSRTQTQLALKHLTNSTIGVCKRNTKNIQQLTIV